MVAAAAAESNRVLLRSAKELNEFHPEQGWFTRRRECWTRLLFFVSEDVRQRVVKDSRDNPMKLKA
jgi:hypothetical protein